MFEKLLPYRNRTFTWNQPLSWEENCGTGSHQFYVFIGANGTIPATPTITTTSLSATYTLPVAGTYSWWIQAFNGMAGNVCFLIHHKFH